MTDWNKGSRRKLTIHLTIVDKKNGGHMGACGARAGQGTSKPTEVTCKRCINIAWQASR